MKKQKFGAGTARIFKRLSKRKPELLLSAAAMVIFALIWGADALFPKPIEVFVPATAAQSEELATKLMTDSSTAGATEGNEPFPPQTHHTTPKTTKPEQAVTTTKSSPSAASTAASQQGTININTAGAQALQALPGIGPVKAQAIVDYRTAHGIFLSPEDLLNVKGIGLATLEKILPYLLF